VGGREKFFEREREVDPDLFDMEQLCPCQRRGSLRQFTLRMESSAPILSREWWLTVVVVGLGIHLLASYLKPRLDQAGGWFSRSWALRNEKRKRERQARIEVLKSNEDARRKAQMDEFRHRLDVLRHSSYWIIAGLTMILSWLLKGSPERGLPVSFYTVVFCISAGVSSVEVWRWADATVSAARIRSELSEADNPGPTLYDLISELSGDETREFLQLSGAERVEFIKVRKKILLQRRDE
jgi:hypothetical protein